uniref:hypothetical protein n=1 Tax=Streptosporangium sp. CA-235898 TaxID=3240073 RepID=UPI003F4997B8
MKIQVTLFTCGRCKKGYNNPVTHVCSLTLTKAARRGGVPGLTSTTKKKTPKKK